MKRAYLMLRDAARSQVYAGYVDLPAWPLLSMRCSEDLGSLCLPQRFCDGTQILPGHPLVGRRAQQIRRMEGGERADHPCAGVVVEPLAAGPLDAFAGRQQGRGRGIAERDDPCLDDQFGVRVDELQAE